jgi:nicotinamide mononucleotide transporter
LTNLLEYTSVAFGVAYIFLATRRSVWCWPVGIIASALGVLLFIMVKLYAEAILFSYYVIIGFYGWWSWKSASKGAKDGFEVVQMPMIHHYALLLLGYFGTALLYYFLRVNTDAAMPLLDSFTTSFAFIATWLTARRVLENWVYWLVINAFTIYLYFSRGLEVFAMLSALYTILSAYGYVQWLKRFNAETQ